MSLTALVLFICVSPFMSGCNRPTTIEPPSWEEVKSVKESRSLQQRIDAVVDHTLNKRRLNSTDHAAWQVVHAILAYGYDLKIEHQGQLVPALEFLLAGNRINGWNLRPGTHGILVPVEPESKAGQGHPDQWLGYISQLPISADTPVVVWKKNYKLRDLLTQSQYDITDGMEASWMLMALSNKDYWPNIDQTWKSASGAEWSAERVAQMEAEAPIVGAACGGTHRLQSLALFLQRMRAEKGDKAYQSTAYQVTNARVQEFIEEARRLQNPDGSFSSNYFARPGMVVDIKDRIDTTGHVLEFLTMAADDKTFDSPWVLKMCECLVMMMEKSEEAPLDCGGLYHTAHGLKLYRERKWGKVNENRISKNEK